MPELPEVETVRHGLELVIENAKIIKTDQRSKALRIPFPDDLASKLKNKTIISLGRRAKYLLLHLDDRNILVVHLGMSGRILIIKPAENYKAEKHDHLILELDNGFSVILNDARRFGMVFTVSENELDHHKAFAGLGPEPLGNHFSAEVLVQKLKGKKTAIKQALLDQKVVAGLGNIYVCEALYKAGIDPRRASGTLALEEIERLVPAIKDVLKAAILAGGSSLKDYRKADGELGYFQHSFSVYDREGQACPECNCNLTKTGGIQRIKQAGRSTFYCPACQN